MVDLSSENSDDFEIVRVDNNQEIHVSPDIKAATMGLSLKKSGTTSFTMPKMKPLNLNKLNNSSMQ